MVEHLALLWGEDLLVLKVELPFLTLDNTLCIIFARNFLAYCVLHGIKGQLFACCIGYHSMHGLHCILHSETAQC